MATNKKKIFVTESMSQQGRALLHARDDIELVEFPNMISATDFEAMLKEHAPVHGVALGGTRFGEPELEASKDMQVVTRIGVGFDAVDVPALSRRKVPLMVAGTANSPSVAEQALFMMLTLAKRAVEMHSMVRDNKWAAGSACCPTISTARRVLIVGFGRIGTRTAKRCLAMEMNVLVFDPYKPAAEIKAAGCEAVTRPRCRIAARRLRQHPLPEDAGDRRHVQRGAVEADEADRLSDQHRAWRHRRRDRRCMKRWCPASSPAPASTCSSRSRRRPATRCSSFRTSSWRRMSRA